MKPLGHVSVGMTTIVLSEVSGLSMNPVGIMLGSLIPDADFLLLVPFFGRKHGHRTALHSLIFCLTSALIFKRFGLGSVFLGAMLHTIIDDFSSGDPPGVGWFWPLYRHRISLSRIFHSWIQQVFLSN